MRVRGLIGSNSNFVEAHTLAAVSRICAARAAVPWLQVLGQQPAVRHTSPTAGQPSSTVSADMPSGTTVPDDSPQQQQTAPRNAISSSAATTPGLRAWTGLKIVAIQFRGVESSSLDPLPAELEVQPGARLEPQKVRESLRRLFSTGLYRSIDVQGVRNGDQVTIIFVGTPRLFVGTVAVTGVKADRLSSQLVRASKLYAGTPFSDTRLARADELLTQTLEENGYYEAKVSTENL